MSDIDRDRALAWLDAECERDYFGQQDAINLRAYIREAAAEIERLRAALSAAYEECAKVADAEQAVAERALADPSEPMTEMQTYLFEVQADTAADIATRIRLLGKGKG